MLRRSSDRSTGLKQKKILVDRPPGVELQPLVATLDNQFTKKVPYAARHCVHHHEMIISVTVATVPFKLHTRVCRSSLETLKPHTTFYDKYSYTHTKYKNSRYENSYAFRKIFRLMPTFAFRIALCRILLFCMYPTADAIDFVCVRGTG